MRKTINIICDECASEFDLNFNEKFVKDYEEVYCPFCKEIIESSDEKEEDDDDSIPYQTDMWEDE